MKHSIFFITFTLIAFPGMSLAAGGLCAEIGPRRSIGSGCYEWEIENSCSFRINITVNQGDGHTGGISLGAYENDTARCCDNKSSGKDCRNYRFLKETHYR